MVSSETIFLFAGRNYRIFSSTFVPGICYGSRVLCVGIYYDCSNHSTDINLGRSGCRLAVNGMYYLFGERGSTVLSWNRGRDLAKTYLETKHRPIFILKESKVQTAGKAAGDSFVGSGVNAVMREKKSGEESHEDKTVKASA